MNVILLLDICILIGVGMALVMAYSIWEALSREKGIDMIIPAVIPTQGITRKKTSIFQYIDDNFKP